MVIRTGDLPVCLGEFDMVDLLVETGATASRSAAKRLINTGSVEIDEGVVGRVADVYNGSVLRCGKHFWRRLLSAPPIIFNFEVDGDTVNILPME